MVRAEGAIQTPQDLEQIVLKSEDGRVLRVGDVASVRIGSLTRYGAVTKDGKGEAVEGLVLSMRGADASAVVKACARTAPGAEAQLAGRRTLNVFYDRSDLIQRAVGTVKKALIEATVLVVVLLLLFLGSLRAALVVAVTLPMAALITFLMMQFFGMSANLMSLGGLAIAIGLIVDAAVVVVENTVERALAHATSAFPSFTASITRRRGCPARRLRHPHYLPRLPAAALAAGPGGQAVRAGRDHHHHRLERLAAACR